MTSMIERVAQAICLSKTCEGISCCQNPSQRGRLDCPVSDGGYNDAARAAIAVHKTALADDGLVIVPLVPTEAMIAVGRQEIGFVADAGSFEIMSKAAYQAMVGAVPGEDQ